MKLQTFYFNKGIIREDLKRFWGMGALYFLALIFTGPIIFLINGENSNRMNSIIETYFNIYEHGFQLVFAVIFPIILGTLIFRYIQLKNAAGMMHSLPFTRNILFNSHLLANLIILSLPIFINFIIMFFIYKGVYTGVDLVIGDVYKWIFVVLLLNYTVLFMTVFTGMISGVSFIQSILSFVFLFLPLGLTGLILVALDSMLFGFVPDTTIIQNFALKVIPITNELYKREVNPLWIIWYMVLLMILFFVSKYLYKKRHLESAGDSIAFDILKPLFKYGVAFCTMILGGLYFSEIVMKGSFWLYFGFFIGGLFGYVIAEMILEKSIWIFNKLWGFLPFIIVTGLFFTVVELDLVGYEKKLPNLKNIEGVYFGHYISGEKLKQDNQLLYDQNNIKKIRNLHKMIIRNKSKIENRSLEENRENIAIGYKLKNGKILIREYDVPKNIANSSLYLKEIYESQEYKKVNDDIFKINVDEVATINIYGEYINKEIIISNKDEIKELIEVMKKDVLNETYEEMTSNKEPWASMYIMYKEKIGNNEKESIYLPLKKSYEGLEKWFKEKGYDKKISVKLQNNL